MLADRDHAGSQMRFEKNPGQAADRRGILAEGAVTDAVCGIRTGQVEDRGQVHAESEASEGPDHGARLLSDRPGCGSPASQREVRGDGAEDRPQAVHPAALLVQSNEGRDPQETFRASFRERTCGALSILRANRMRPPGLTRSRSDLKGGSRAVPRNPIQKS